MLALKHKLTCQFFDVSDTTEEVFVDAKEYDKDLSKGDYDHGDDITLVRAGI
jgi:hypothetical protein